jgi:hypothetical protein
MTHGELLALTLDKTRESTLGSFKLLKNEHIHRRLNADGVLINSPFWTMAHLAVSENFLCLHAIGGPRLKLAWARNFGLGSVPLPPDACPPLNEIIESAEAVHKQACDFIRSLSDEQLAAPTTTGTTFGGEDRIDLLIIHAIRHEGIHSGHLGLMVRSWIGPTI